MKIKLDNVHASDRERIEKAFKTKFPYARIEMGSSPAVGNAIAITVLDGPSDKTDSDRIELRIEVLMRLSNFGSYSLNMKGKT